MSIAGLQSKEPVGAVLTVGMKNASGQPIDKDRFYIKVPDANGVQGANDKSWLERANHPAFSEFNGAEAKYRQTMTCVLVHATEAECFEWNRKAQKFPKPFANHSKLPACTGDGVRAKRLALVGNEIHYNDIPCPNELCQYAQKANERTPPFCKPWARLLFQPVWPAGSKLAMAGRTPLMKYTTQSWHTISGLVGMFDHIRDQAALLGVKQGVNLYGLPFEMILTQKTDPEKGNKYPVVRFSPTVNLQEFLIRQAQRVQQLAAGPSYIGLLDAPEQDPDVLLADKATIEPGPMQQPRG